ncbi:MAG: NADH-quinone oxidoreductase subunit A [Deltaproteobacteria bacterium]|nr:MAG: NADH-quinone oxidoreductase subunit A [Deltaproteobacteria bacterium]
MIDYVAILMLGLVGVAMCATVVALSVLFGPRNPSRWKGTAYESGSEPFGDARIRLDVKYYMIAISFIMFDVEAVFLLPWAVVAKDYGAYGFVVAMVFVTILVVGLVYEWQKGGLEWD